MTPSRRPPAIVLLCAVLLGAGATSAAALLRPWAEGEPAPASVAANPTDSVWSRDQQAVSPLAIGAAIYAGLPREAGVWRRERNGVREIEDRLAVGQAVAGPFLLVKAVRRSPDDAAPPFFVEIARTAADRGLSVGRLVPGEPVGGRFGPAQIARLSLAAPSGGAGPREAGARQECIGWRTDALGVGVVLVGIACFAAPVPPSVVSCIVQDLAVPAGMEEHTKPGTVSAVGCGGTSPVVEKRVSSSQRSARTRTAAKLSPSPPVGPRGERAID